MAWSAAHYICTKRLIPFLPELVPALERHGHLVMSEDVREQLLDLSTATADRLLRPLQRNQHHQAWDAAETPGAGTDLRGLD